MKLIDGTVTNGENSMSVKLIEDPEGYMRIATAPEVALEAENRALREIAEAAESLIDHTVYDLIEVKRREVRLSHLLRAWRSSSFPLRQRKGE